jgi:hypothetical protein
MKPRRLIEAKESVCAGLALALERIAALEAWKDRTETREDRQSIVNLRHNERISALEGADAQPEIGGQTVRGFAAKVHRSPSAIRKLIRQRRIPFEQVGVHVIVAADATLPPRRQKSTIRPA